MALPNPLANPAAFSATAVGQFVVFPFLKPRTARHLLNILGIRAPEHHYIHCDLKCESGQRPNHLHETGGWTPAPPWNQAGYLAVWNCKLRAWYRNFASADANNPHGYNEPSYCEEPQNLPHPGMHPSLHPGGRPLVCALCKLRRTEDLVWKKNELLFGVCKSCRTWAIGNMEPNTSNCTCPPVGNCPPGRNNGEERYKHLCRAHQDAYWNQIRPPALIETNTRMSLMRRRPRQTKRGHGWTKMKQHGPKPVRTPQERRAATRRRVTWYVQPRCFCGEDVGPTGHDYTGPGGANMNNAQVRNCVGCNGFVRRY